LKTEKIPRSYLESERKERIGAVIGLESLAKLRGKRSSAPEIFDRSFEASQKRPKLQAVIYSWYMIQQIFITGELLIDKTSTSRTLTKLTRQKALEKKKVVLGSKNLKQLKFTKPNTGPE
jgi:hypothetical protein